MFGRNAYVLWVLKFFSRLRDVWEGQDAHKSILLVKYVCYVQTSKTVL